MRRTQLAVLLVVALVVVPSVALGVVRGSPDLTVSASENRVTPGEATQLTVTVTNTGDLDKGSATNPSLDSQVTTARGMEVELKNGDAPVSVRSNARTVGQLPEGQTADLPFEIAIDEDADPGTYDMEAVVEYTYYSSISEQRGTRNEETETQRFDVTIEVVDRARFEVVDTETDVRIGSSGTVAVTMENVGTEAASDTSVSLESLNSDLTFGQTSSGTRYVGEWPAGETETIEYRVTASDNAEQQRYAFQATASFEDSDGATHQSAPLSLGVQPLPEQRFRVVETDSDIAVGDTGTVSVTLRNDGAITAQDATVELQSGSSDIVFGESASTSSYVGGWPAGETRTVTVDATAADGAEPRSYALSSSVSYEDQNGDSAASRSVSFGVTPDPETGFALSDVTSDLRVGEERQLTGTVTNEGDSPAQDVVVRFATENRNIEVGEREYAVGTLAPGESAEFAYNVEVSDTADSGPRQFTFVAEYRNSDGDARVSDDLLIRQDVGPESDAFAVEIVDGTVTNGDTSTLEVEVTNTANESLTDISAKMFADSPISVPDSEAFIKRLEPGESTTVQFTVGASGATPKTYPLKLDFEYDDEDGDTLLSDRYRVPIDVEESNGGGSFPLLLLGLGLVVAIAIGGYVRFR